MKQLALKVPYFSYLAAVIVTLFAVAIRLLFDPLLGPYMILVTIYGAVAFTSWLGGYRPALVTTILGYFLCNYFVIKPAYTWSMGPEQIVGFVFYFITCSIIMALGELNRNAQATLLKKESELRNSELRVREILESITDAFYTLDAQWQFSYVNPAAEKSLGKTAVALINKSIWEEYPEIVGSEIDVLFSNVVTEKASGTITTFCLPHKTWYEIRAYPNGHGLSVYFQDVSKRIEAEQLLILQSAELSEMDRRKNEFLATLAHELRNPLAPILNSLSMLDIKSHDELVVTKAHSVIRRQVSQMVRLIDDLMDVSRINHGKLELKRSNIALSEVIRAAIESSRPIIEAAKLELDITLPSDTIILNADLTRLTQVFLNLLNNAAKFTKRGGQIAITTELRSKNTDGDYEKVLISIRDTGIGITPQDQSKIFESFIQLPSSMKRSHGGLGVGLMLVKRIVELHSGSVKVFSKGRGLGSTFTVELPLLTGNPVIDAQPEIQIPPHQSSVQLRIMIVDDNQLVAISLANYFEALGYETVVAHDGTTAVEMAERYQPNVIFLDIGMPNLNGYEVASHIREQSWGKSVKLIAVTGWGQPEDRRKTASAGFDSHFVKPVDPSVLSGLLIDHHLHSADNLNGQAKANS